MYTPIKVDIAKPCTQRWDDMTPTLSGNYCNSCKKTVIDFTGMSDNEVYQFMHLASSSVCGRFDTNQLNKVLQPTISQPNARYRKTVWQLLLAGTLFAHQAKTQDKPTTPASFSYPIPAADSIVLDDDMYLVVDSITGEALQGASIIIDRKDFYSDDKGVFRLKASAKTITISYIGYKPREFRLEDEALPKKIQLQPSADLLDEVSIFGGASTTCTGRLGGVSYGRVISRYEEVVRTLKQWIPNKNVRAFPNPIGKGQSLSIQLSFPTPGNYAMKIFASDGRLIHVQGLQITSAKHSLQFPISSTYAAGTYWLHVQDDSGKQKGHEVKFIVR